MNNQEVTSTIQKINGTWFEKTEFPKPSDILLPVTKAALVERKARHQAQAASLQLQMDREAAKAATVQDQIDQIEEEE